MFRMSIVVLYLVYIEQQASRTSTIKKNYNTVHYVLNETSL